MHAAITASSGLPRSSLSLVRPLVELFGDVADRFGQRKLVTPARNVAECGEKVPLGTRILGTRCRVLRFTRSRAMPVPLSLKPMMVSSWSKPSLRGSDAAPTREESSPSSSAKVLGRAELPPARTMDELCRSTYPPLASSINNTATKN